MYVHVPWPEVSEPFFQRDLVFFEPPRGGDGDEELGAGAGGEFFIIISMY